MTGARMGRWSNAHRGASKNQANNQQSPNCARSFVVSVRDYYGVPANDRGHVITGWMGKLKATLRRVLTAVEANGSPGGGPHQPLLRVHPSVRHWTRTVHQLLKEGLYLHRLGWNRCILA